MGPAAPGFWVLQGRGPDELGLPGPAIAFVAILALAILALNIWATISVARGRLSTLAKVLWILGIWFVSPIGAILYVLLGRTR